MKPFDLKAAKSGAEAHALQKVQDAFYEDSKDRNSRDNCRQVSIKWLKKLCAGGSKKTPITY
jgi:hypothetical protein